MGNRKPNIFRLTKYLTLRGARFLRHDIWRLSPEETAPPLRQLVAVVKIVYQTTLRFIDDHLIDRAASLTYSSVLSIVPMLAVIVGIAKGFGLQTTVGNALREALPGHQAQLDRVFVYVENYLGQVQGGLFIGLGLIILLYTVLMLISSIEDAFNDIWQAPHPRPWSRRIFDYFGLFLLLPIMITASSLITLTMSTIRSTYLGEIDIFRSVLDGALGLVPFGLSVTLFVGLYMYLPNVRVRFVPALISGTLAGMAYQIFQALYISGVIWISRYNAIYGSFAAVPLLLLWLQLSWSITLYGAQLGYVIQNIRSYSFGQASLNVSRRYLDFVALLILSRITKRFALAQPLAAPYTAQELSNECQIPLRMTGQMLARLVQVGLLSELKYDQESSESYYQPAIDSGLMTVSYVIGRLDRYGTEDFRIDRHQAFASEWQAMLASRTSTPNVLVKDL